MPSSTGTLVFNDQKIQAPDIYATESLGVGVSDPTSNLQVAGNAYVSSNLEIGTANLFVDTTTGRVGVGTGSPLYPFHIHTDTKPQLFIEGNNNSNATLRSGSGPNYRNTYQEIDFGHYAIANRGADNYIDFKVTSGEVAPTTRMRITGEGNVGIGVTNPSATLDVNGYALNRNPAFYAWDNTTSRTLSSTTSYRVLMNSTKYNIGSHYDTSTSQFTAPKTGIYIFAAVIAHDTAGALNGSVYFSFYVNGQNRRDILEGVGSHTAHFEQHGVYIVNLTVGDVVDVRSRSSSAITFVNGNHGAYYRNCFQGALLG